MFALDKQNELFFCDLNIKFSYDFKKIENISLVNLENLKIFEINDDY